MIYGFTGTQKGMTSFQKQELNLRLEGCTEFTHGDCIGSDEQANQIAFELGIEFFTIFPPTDTKKRAYCFNPEKDLMNDNAEWRGITWQGRFIHVRWMPKDDYLKRNKKIVDHCSKMLATPKEYEHSLRSGTWACIRYAWKVKRDIIIIPPVNRTD